MSDPVIFGRGAESQLVDALVERGAERVLLVALAPYTDGAERLRAALGDRAVGLFDGVKPQVPREVADAAIAMARDTQADWIVAHGGGSAIGVAKAIALELDVQLAAVPTTYAGSERTSIWGITTNGRKTTGRDERVRPRLVAYDPALTHALPRQVSLLSMLNALAHSVEGLYAAEATAEARQAARDSLRPLLDGLVGLGADPDSPDARDAALRGAWKAAEALGGASIALHHKLAHVLGGSFGTAHATTHGTLLPYSMAFNLEAAPEALRALQEAWEVSDPAAHLYDLMRELGLSVRLKDLGLTEEELPEVARLAVQKQYPNPRPVVQAELLAMLLDAWHGRRPTRGHGRLDTAPVGAHTGLLAATAGVPLNNASAVILAVHGRGANADRFLADLRQRAGAAGDDVAWVALQARDNSWYPTGFLEPVDDNQPWFGDALATLDAAWALAREQVPAERIAVVGFSQGACLLLSWLRASGVRPGHVLAFSGAPTPVPGDFTQLAGVPVHLGIAAGDAWVPLEVWQTAVDDLTAAGAQIDAVTEDTTEHTIHPSNTAALRRTLEALVTPPFETQTGFGNHLKSEAVDGALPLHQNAPQHVPYGLIAEQINGTGFTVERARNRRTWMYRLRPAIHDRPFTAMDNPPPHFVARFDHGSTTPEVQRYKPVSVPTEPTDFLDGVLSFAGAGDPAIKRGMAIHLYAANTHMERAFANIDGDLLIVPQQGRVRAQTELGWLEAGPGELLLIPRALRFRIELPDGASRGFVTELYEGHLELPNRGIVGANGLADERHFHAPVAAYEDKPEDTVIVVKQGGEFWQTVAPNSPFDVVAWHGTYAPFVYRLDDFNALGAVSFDHPDPSLLTVLTAPMDTHGRSAIDVAVFKGRWDAAEGTFRPPYFHRNSAIEFNAVISATSDTGPYKPGTFTYTPYLTPHGVSVRTQRHELDREEDVPYRIPDESLWVQFESTYVLRVLPRWLSHPQRDTDFRDNFTGWRTGELTKDA